MSQLSFLMPKSDWRPPESLPDLRGRGPLAIDVETRDPFLRQKGPGTFRKDNYIVGYVLTVKDLTMYLPVRHEGGGNMDPKLIHRYVTDQVSNPDQLKVFHNALYDLELLQADGINVPGPVYDTMIAEALINEHRDSYALDNVGYTYTGERKSKDILIDACRAMGFGTDWGSNLWRIHPQYVGEYAEQDGSLTLRVYEAQKQQIVEQDLASIVNLEMQVLRVIQKMRWRGVRVDLDRTEQLIKEWKEKEAECLAELKRQTGLNIDVWSSDSCSKAFDDRGLSYPRTATGLPSFQQEWLEQQAGQGNALAYLIVRARKYSKAWSTFGQGMILGHVTPDGRIHPQMHPTKTERDDGGQAGTVGGRFSYTQPNLQQAPSRDPEIGPAFRSVFIPENGCQWGIADYSQQEPRLTVHYAALRNFKGADEAVRKYRDDPRTDYHQMLADMAGIKRKQAKELNLGLAYNMGKVKLCHKLGLPTLMIEKEDRAGNKYQVEVAGPEGEGLFKLYHEKVPFIKALTYDAMNVAQARGFIRTLLGRRCRFPLWEPVLPIGYRGRLPRPCNWEQAQRLVKDPSSRLWFNHELRRAMCHKAMNRLIQGSAGDQTKKAMVLLAEEGLYAHIQVHDELDFSFESEAQGKRAQEIMEHAVELLVPSKVDLELGPSWGEAK